MIVQKPRFKHDCTGCTFLGHYDDGDEKRDIYWCCSPSDPILDSIIARFGDDGPEYRSQLPPGDDAEEWLARAPRWYLWALVTAHRDNVRALALPKPKYAVVNHTTNEIMDVWETKQEAEDCAGILPEAEPGPYIVMPVTRKEAAAWVEECLRKARAARKTP